MDEARRVLDRLDRIDTLHRGDAAPRVMLGELQALLLEAEAWARVEAAAAPEARAAVDRLGDALSEGQSASRGGRRTLVA